MVVQASTCKSDQVVIFLLKPRSEKEERLTIMKRIVTTFLILASLVGVVAAQKTQTPAEREQGFRNDIGKAKWVLVTKDEDGEPYYIDSLTMGRVMSTVIFATKSSKRGTIEYSKVGGGCTKDLFVVSIKMVSNPGVKELVGGEIENPDFETVTKGTVGYIMLDYVCKNAKVIQVK